jgi:glycosyltransferase involved in cell wall biosynthesis
MVSMHRLNDQVVFFGNLAYEEAISSLKTADIVVNPSYTEGLPTSVTEAALCRKAIIATEVGGTPEVISGIHDGFLIPPGQSSLIAEKITLLVENPELRNTFSQNAYEEVRNKFNWDISAIKYIEIFQRMVSDKKT